MEEDICKQYIIYDDTIWFETIYREEILKN